MMKKNNIWMITLWAGTLFFSGVIAGFFVSHLVSPPPPWHNRSGPPPGPPSPEKLKEMISNRRRLGWSGFSSRSSGSRPCRQ